MSVHCNSIKIVEAILFLKTYYIEYHHSLLQTRRALRLYLHCAERSVAVRGDSDRRDQGVGWGVRSGRAGRYRRSSHPD